MKFAPCYLFGQNIRPFQVMAVHKDLKILAHKNTVFCILSSMKFWFINTYKNSNPLKNLLVFWCSNLSNIKHISLILEKQKWSDI
jgi:hypothetical protein